ncbi:hypothetical protein RND71_041991 [Anisodus tanguticus]|uniref:Uncharacterized protein n=1 Tax=Anisodus tanguticus TaxID=243964 RepID=A0AAE1QV75_9SOLA|nr:hypothetical protein RND71_041991 [Anisodus tanguticus]
MSGAVLVAVAAAIGSFLQGWDNATIAGLIVAMSLIGAVLITTCSGAIADWLSRRPLLITSSVLYFVSGLVILWVNARRKEGFAEALRAGRCICREQEMELLSVGAAFLFLALRIIGEMALLVEGLGVGGKTSVEEYIIGPANEFVEDREPSAQKDQIRLYGPEQGRSLVARPVIRQSVLGIASRQGSTFAHNVSLMDPVVALFGSVYEKFPDAGSKGSMLFPHLGSTFSVAGNQTKNEEWDEENLAIEGNDYASDAPAEESDDNLQSPLISRQTTSLEKDMVPPPSHGSIFSIMQGNDGEPVGSAGIGGGWQLAWKWTERECDDGKEGGFKRIYLHEGGAQGIRRGSLVSLTGGDMPGGGEFVRAAALVSQPALYSKDAVGPAMIHPSEATGKGPSWSDLFEPGVKHALIVGVGIQILQQVGYVTSLNPDLKSVAFLLYYRSF